MSEQGIDFRAVLQMLSEAEVRYVVVGGVAMYLQGANHFTLDVDIGYARSPTNFTALTRALAKHRARLRGVPDDVPFVLDERTFRNTWNLTLRTDLGDLDLLGDVAGVESFEGLWERSVEMDLDGLRIRVASLDDLISMKRAANRPKDQLHLMELEALRRLIEEEQSQSNRA